MEVTKLTVPETVAPFAGELIVTEPAGVGVELGVAVCAEAWGVPHARIASSVKVGARLSCLTTPTTRTTFETLWGQIYVT